MKSNVIRKQQPRGLHLVQETFLTDLNDAINDNSNTSRISGAHNAQIITNVGFWFPLPIITISNFPSDALTCECTGIELAHTRNGRGKCWQ